MTFKSLFMDLQILSLFLLAGYLLREFCPLLQRIFLPSAVIGGVIALIGGQQVLGLWTVPKSFSSFSGQLITLIMTALIWGVHMNKEKIQSYLDYFCFLNGVRFGQIAIGAATGILLRYIWTSLPKGWGTMGYSAYFGGHGTVATYAGVFESLGMGKDYMGIGMIMATMGLICAVVVGMIFVNIGVRKGWTAYVKIDDKLGKYEEKRLLPAEQRKPIGTMRVPSGSINALAFQFAMMMALIYFGHSILNLLGRYVWSPLSRVPNNMYGIVGAVIIWPIMCKLHLQDYVDRKTCTQLSGFALEILIVGAIATLNLKVLSAFWVPIVIQFVIMTAFTAIMCFWYNKRIAEKEWFEKSIFVFGQSTGATPTGLALVRAVDPDSIACPAEAHAVESGVGGVMFSWIPALLPALAISSWPWSEVGLGLIGFIICVASGWILFRKKIRALGR